MNDIQKFFEKNTGRLIHKWHHYFDIYDRHFSKYRGKEVVILEIGVYQGGSLKMWQDYFGPKARLYAIDIDPNCKSFEDEQTKIFIGSQSDREFLKKTMAALPPIDIFIDDGGHTMKQQIVSFEEIFSHVKSDGVYLCEDLHTSYWPIYGGGYKRKSSFIEYSKNWIDALNAFHSPNNKLKVTEFTKSVKGIHYYDSIVVVEKAPIEPPKDSMSGNASIPTPVSIRPKNFFERNFNKVMGALNLPFYID